ncbi:MAG: hypothetical protein V4582_01805 [Pseudomonadota bacterium]
MNQSPFERFVDVLEEAGRTFTKVIRNGTRAVASMSWPALLMFCVALAMLLSIVPLALFLFAVFMAIKLIVAAMVLGSRRQRGEPPQPGVNGGSGE